MTIAIIIAIWLLGMPGHLELFRPIEPAKYAISREEKRVYDWIVTIAWPLTIATALVMCAISFVIVRARRHG